MISWKKKQYNTTERRKALQLDKQCKNVIEQKKIARKRLKKFDP